MISHLAYLRFFLKFARDKYYDYKDDDYYYDDEEAYDDYYDYYDAPSKSRQKSRRRQSSKGAIDRQYGGKKPFELLLKRF